MAHDRTCELRNKMSSLSKSGILAFSEDHDSPSPGLSGMPRIGEDKKRASLEGPRYGFGSYELVALIRGGRFSPCTGRFSGTFGSCGVEFEGAGFGFVFSPIRYLALRVGTSPSRITRLGGTEGSCGAEPADTVGGGAGLVSVGLGTAKTSLDLLRTARRRSQ